MDLDIHNRALRLEEIVAMAKNMSRVKLVVSQYQYCNRTHKSPLTKLTHPQNPQYKVKRI